MARKPDGKAAATQRVTFTRPAAERIAKVVREVEQGNRDTVGLSFGTRLQSIGSGVNFRICKYTGAWSIGQTKTVEFYYQTATPNTVQAYNLFLELPDAGTTPKACAIQKDQGTWHLTQVRFFPGDFVHNVELGTANLTFSRYRGMYLEAEVSPINIAITTCATATSS